MLLGLIPESWVWTDSHLHMEPECPGGKSHAIVPSMMSMWKSRREVLSRVLFSLIPTLRPEFLGPPAVHFHSMKPLPQRRTKLPDAPSLFMKFILGCLGRTPCSPESVGTEACSSAAFSANRESLPRHLHYITCILSTLVNLDFSDWLIVLLQLLPLLPVTELPPNHHPGNSTGIPEKGKPWMKGKPQDFFPA